MKGSARNAPCPCGSGKKFKRCCGAPGSARATATTSEATRVEHPRRRVPARRRYPYFYAHLTDYLDGADLSDRIPREARRLGLYIGRIAAAASRAEPGELSETSIHCRRRPASRACGGRVRVEHEEGGDRIDWHCPSCGDAGSISAWRGTPFDLSDMPPGERVLLEIEDVRCLQKLAHLSAPALRVVVSAYDSYDCEDKLELEGRRSEFRALARCILLELGQGRGSRAAARRLVDLHHFCSEVSGDTPDLSPTALATEVVLHEESRSHRLRRLPASGSSAGGHVLHVRLLEIEPPVWRRLEVSSGIPLADLAVVLLLAMGWSDTHLHLFRQGKRLIAPPETLEDLETEDSRAVLLSDLLRAEGDACVWEYDFGDGWCHEMRAESLVPQPPPRARLLAGQRACPPEDCGGPPGYEELLAALSDPEHEEHARFVRWAGASFDPEAFDLERHDLRLKRLAKVWGASKLSGAPVS